MFTIAKKQKSEEEGSEALPPRNRQFKMKERLTTEPPKKETPTCRRDPLKDALRGPAKLDAEALERAYSSPDGVYTYGNTEFVAGTRGPIWGKRLVAKSSTSWQHSRT